VSEVKQDAWMTFGGGRPGLLVVGHGTRDARGVSEFLAVVDGVARWLPQVVVRPGFLELAEPTIGEAIAAFEAGGVDRLVVSPVLLFAADHAKRDIPRAIDDALRAHPRMATVQAAHLGTHAQLLALSALRYQEATARLVPLPPGETLLLLVGRGSRDRDATAEMSEFSRLTKLRNALPHVAVAFYAMAQPSLEATLEELRAKSFRRIVVQPHLLFNGRILDQIAALVKETKRRTPNQEWVLCEHLGPAPWLVDALVDRASQALTGQQLQHHR